MRKFIVDKNSEGTRVDVFVADNLPRYTRSSLRGLFKKGEVLVNGNPEDPGDKLKESDVVTIQTRLLMEEPDVINLPVTFEDENVVVINKPAGILTHSKGAINAEPTVASFIKTRIQDEKLTGNRAGIVHRLDRATSGLIIAAKNGGSLKFLQNQFAKRQVKKNYIAVVHGDVKPPQAIIDVPIERNPSSPQTFRAGSGGKPAQTKYSVLKTFTKGAEKYSLLELQPFTGRTHQLRVHLAYIGNPIVGDYVYGKKDSGPMMLHAASLELTLPNGLHKKFVAALPETFSKLISE